MKGDAPQVSISVFNACPKFLTVHVPADAKGYDTKPWSDYKVIYGDINMDYLKGDVNEDGEVNIKDLQIILRSVCEKVKLTDRQKLIADVVEDGEVNVQDLRQVLRFVCGKIKEL